MSRGAEPRLHRPAARASAATIALAAVWLGSLANSVAAAPEPAFTAGIGGVHRTGYWTPVVVRPPLDGPSGLRAWVDDADGQLVGSPPLTARRLPPAARFVIAPAGQGGDAGAIVTTGLPSSRGQELPGTALPSTTPLLLLHGDLPAVAAAAALVAGERTAMEVVRLTEGPLPTPLSPRDLDAFDATVVCGRGIAQLLAAARRKTSRDDGSGVTPLPCRRDHKPGCRRPTSSWCRCVASVAWRSTLAPAASRARPHRRASRCLGSPVRPPGRWPPAALSRPLKAPAMTCRW